MKTLYFILLKILFISSFVVGQQGTPPFTIQQYLSSQQTQDVAFLNERIGWVVGYHSSQSSQYIWRTTNGGFKWIQSDELIPQNQFSRISAVNENVVYVSGVTTSTPLPQSVIFRTSDGGQTWNLFRTGGQNTSIVCLHYFPNSDKIFIESHMQASVTTYTIFRTKNGVNSSWVINGFNYAPQFYFSDVNNGTAVMAQGKIKRTTNSGLTWFDQNSGTTMHLRDVHFIDENYGAIIGDNQTILRTTNGGLNWNSQNINTSRQIRHVNFYDQITGVVGGEFGSLFYTSNGGADWIDYSLDSQWHFRSISITEGNHITVTGTNGSHSMIFRGFYIPELLSPAINSLGLNNQIILEWKKVQSATSYQVSVSLDENFSNVIFSDSTITDTSVSLPLLNSGTKYYWKVKAKINNEFYGGYSTVFNFTTLDVPLSVDRIYPLNNAMHLPLNVTFIWKKAIDYTRSIPSVDFEFNTDEYRAVSNYWFELVEDTVSMTGLIRDTTFTDTSKTITGLSGNTTYYWRARAKNEIGWGPFNSWWKFTTLNVPLSVERVYPLHNAINIPLNISFLWRKGFDYSLLNSSNQSKLNSDELRTVSNYWFELVRDTVSMTGLIRDTTLTDTLKSVTGLSKNTTYYWRVRAKNEVGWGSFNNWWSFGTVPNVLPVANTLTNINNMNAGRQLTQHYTFTSSGSYDPDGVIDSVRWYVNDKPVGTDTILTYPFPQGITFVRLVVFDDDGASASSTATVTRTTFRQYLGGPVYAGLSLIGDSILYAVASNDKVYKMDIDGNIFYNLSVNGNVLSSNSISIDSSIFIGSSDNNLYGFSRYGAPLWPALTLGGQITATPTIDSASNRIYVGISNGFLHVVNKNTGNVAWSSFVGSAVQGSAVITLDRKLVLFNVKGDMYGFDLNSASTTHTWFILSNDSVKTSPAIDNDGNIYVGTRGGKLKKITLPEGQIGNVVWETNLGSPVNTSPVIDAGGSIYVGLQNGHLVKVNSSNGEVIWSYNSGSSINTTPALSSLNRIYFGNNAGEIVALDSSKHRIWYYKDSTAIGTALLYEKGTLYAGTIAGRVLAIYDDSTFTDNPNLNFSSPMWGTFQGNNRRTGSQQDVIINIENVTIELPNEYYLSNNYPNPFNPTTKIRYGIPIESNVKIAIYDMLGKEIAILINENQIPGTYEATFDAVGLPSGVYFFRITANDFTRTKRMVLIK